MMKYFVVYCLFMVVTQVICLDVVQNKTGAEQVKDALSKAENESNNAAKSNNKVASSNKDSNKPTVSKDSKTFSKLNQTADDELDKMITNKVAQLEKLRVRHRQLVKERMSSSEGVKENAKVENNSQDDDDELVESFKKAQKKEKENSQLEDASDKKMVEMAKRLNHLVLKFQKKIGHLSHGSKVDSDISSEDDNDSTKKIARGGPTSHGGSLSPSMGGVDLTALRRALGLIKSKGLKLKNGEDSNVKLSYKEDVKLEDRLALEAEEEKKVTNTDSFDDDGAAEAAAGVDKSSVTSSLSSTSGSTTSNSVSPKEQASQEMQSYNALISSESNRELTQIQDEINKATQSSMGKVSVVGQRENVQAESPSLPSLPGLGGEEFGGAAGGGGGGALDGLLNGGGGGGGDPLAAALAAGSENGNNENTNNMLSNSAPGAELGGTSQTSSISDFGAPDTQQQQQQQQQITGASDSSLNLGGETPIEVGSSTPVDMGMYGGGGGAANQQVQLGGAETGVAPGGAGGVGGGLPEEMQSSVNGVPQQQQTMAGEQNFDPATSFKKSKITKKQKKAKINIKNNRFLKAKNFKRTVGKKTTSRNH